MSNVAFRISRVFVLPFLLVLGTAPTARAALGWSYQLIWDVPSTGPTETTGNVCSFAINDQDQVAYVRRIGTVREVVLWESGTNQVVYSPAGPTDPVPKCTTGTGDEATVGLREDGLVTFTVSLPDQANLPALAYARVGTGLLGVIPAISSANIGPEMNPATNGDPNAPGNIAFSTNVPKGLRVTDGGAFLESESLGATTSFLFESAPALTQTDQAVAFANFGSGLSNLQAVIFDPHATGPGRLRTANLSALGILGYPRPAQPSVNEHGIAVGRTTAPVLNGPTQIFAIDINASPPSRIDVFVPPFGPYTQLSGYASINSSNQIAFTATGSGSESPVLLGDVAESPPLVVVGAADTLDIAGLTFDQLGNGVVTPSGNGDSGKIAFSSRARKNGATNVFGLFLAVPEPGITPGDPVIPIPSPPGEPVEWVFRGCPNSFMCCSACFVANRATYYDPPFVAGYSYETDGIHPNFTSVLIPAPLPGGDKDFVLQVGGQFFLLPASTIFNFQTLVPGGVGSFTITDIDPAEALDPADPRAFVTGLTFAAPIGPNDEFRMTPIEVPEPSGVLAIACGVALLACVRPAAGCWLTRAGLGIRVEPDGCLGNGP